MNSIRIEQARTDELAQAFRLALGYLEGDELVERVANAQSLVALGDLDPEGILVARDKLGICGALVSALLPGAGGLLWPPCVRDGPEREWAEDQLVATACRWLRGRGARLGEALLSWREKALAPALSRNGFTRITHLEYWRHGLQPGRAFEAGHDMHCLTFDRADPGLFRDTLLRTYEGSLDCPELNGVRTMEEIIAGHMGQGKFDPEKWWLIQSGDIALGVVLVTEVADLNIWDLSYLGVAPEWRSRGWGRALAQLAIQAARTAGVSGLMVAVDARNQPAMKLYKNLGFERHEQRDVYLAIWGPADQLPRFSR